jgi:hypothetical protein
MSLNKQHVCGVEEGVMIKDGGTKR